MFTIGFGFGTDTADTAAKDTLKQCVGNKANAYFFPYDGTALRLAFKDIATQITAQTTAIAIKE